MSSSTPSFTRIRKRRRTSQYYYYYYCLALTFLSWTRASFLLHTTSYTRSRSNVLLLCSIEEQQQQQPPATYYSPNVPLGNRRSINNETINYKQDEYAFFDQTTLTVQAGSGGQGASTYKRTTGGQQGPPDGGNGGRGGHVIVLADPSIHTLAAILQRHFVRAEKGQDGMYSWKSGKSGTNAVIRVPVGTVVHEIIVENGEQQLLGRLMLPKQELLVAEGGLGGEGSGVTAATKTRGVLRPRTPPTKGERKVLELTLELIADVALVGVPNAGKSTFLAAVTRAQPKIANYPFTTIIPNLGVWNAEGKGLILCDVPGLIEGAARGVGLGHAFLRHVDRCHVILHLIDATSNDPIADYEMLNREMVAYGSGQLARMPQVVVVNKMDAYEQGSGEVWEEGLKVKFSKEELEQKLKQVMPHSRLLWMSAKEKNGVDDLMGRLAAFVQKVKESAESNETNNNV